MYEEWSAYLAGALLTLAWKFARARLNSTQSWREFLIDWFFSPGLDNTVSWVTTVGLVWVIGVMYISRTVVWAPAGYIAGLPLHSSIAFLLGSILEFVAPNATKWAVEKIPWPWRE